MTHSNGAPAKEFEPLLKSAERIVADRWGTMVRLGEIIRLSEPRRRNLILRCHVLSGESDAPRSVILKRARQRRYDPDDPKSRPAVGLFRDWAGLEFLSSLDEKLPTAPAFYGGDRQQGFFLMEDLQHGEKLDHVLTCGSAARARTTLAQLASALGRMHSDSAGRSDQYQQIRDALGPGDQMHRERLAQHAHDIGPYLAERCQRLGVTVAPTMNADIETVAQAMANPGPFLSYTHADACPDNILLAGDRIRLIDYEFGGFRHALLDGVYGWIRFPTCWCVRDIPEAVVFEMETAYRRELAQECPAANDDETYYRAVADACAYWMLENLASMLDRALRYEEPKGISTNRQQILVRLDAFVHVARRAEHLNGLQRTLASLLKILRDRWDTQIPYYDGFGVPSEMADADVRLIVDAVRNNQIDRVGSMLQANSSLAMAKGEDDDQTPLLYSAVDTGNASLVQLLLEHGADWRVTTRSGWTVLSRACSHSIPQIVDLLLERGADINQRDTWGTLPLYGTSNNRQMMLHLLERGAVADAKMSLDMDRLDIAQRILDADPSQARLRFGTGLTLLHDCARVGYGRVEAMELLLSHGAEVNARTNWGATPLHLAVFHNNQRAAEFLVQHGSDLDSRDDHGLTPLGLAEGKEFHECAKLLRPATEAVDQTPAGFHSVVTSVGLGNQDATPQSNRAAEIDHFYQDFGDTRDEAPHPMDELAVSTIIEHQRRTRHEGDTE